MVKWIALILALIAITRAADDEKVSAKFRELESRIDRRCTLMQVVTPTGNATICAIQ